MTKQLEAKFYAAGAIDTDGCCERVSDDEAQFWTVYERQQDGTSQAICDCDIRQGADAAAAKLNALIAALEQAQQQDKVALETIANLTELWNEGRNRIAELESDASKLWERDAECRRLSKKIAELEASPLAVKLPAALMPAQHASGELFMTPDNVEHGGYLNRDDVLRAIRAAGGTVSEGE